MKGLEEEKEQMQWAAANSQIDMFREQMPTGFEELLHFKIAHYEELTENKVDSPREDG